MPVKHAPKEATKTVNPSVNTNHGTGTAVLEPPVPSTSLAVTGTSAVQAQMDALNVASKALVQEALAGAAELFKVRRRIIEIAPQLGHVLSLAKKLRTPVYPKGMSNVQWVQAYLDPNCPSDVKLAEGDKILGVRGNTAYNWVVNTMRVANRIATNLQIEGERTKAAILQTVMTLRPASDAGLKPHLADGTEVKTPEEAEGGYCRTSR